jgi:hypothetical protein
MSIANLDQTSKPTLHIQELNVNQKLGGVASNLAFDIPAYSHKKDQLHLVASDRIII